MLCSGRDLLRGNAAAVNGDVPRRADGLLRARGVRHAGATCSSAMQSTIAISHSTASEKFGNQRIGRPSIVADHRQNGGVSGLLSPKEVEGVEEKTYWWWAVPT